MAEFTFYELLHEFDKIEIPALQRDYAQGRKNTEEVRNSFLFYLKERLNANIPVTLDFIYGVVDDKPQKLILIDGQQRLTTLFLLYWYLAALNDTESCIDFQDNLQIDSGFSRFRYETRYSSMEFCNKLVSNLNKIDASLFDNRTVSDVIRDQKWFQIQWNNDSTVNSMLVMLDAMQKIFSGIKYNSYRRLEQVFRIDFLNLEDFSINDAGKLYIKMNSRGKTLTRFENLKSKLLSYISTNCRKGMDYEKWLHPSFCKNTQDLKGLSFSDKVGWLIDIRWTDAIWSSLSEKDRDSDKDNQNSLLDRILLNLLVFPLMNECCSRELSKPIEGAEPVYNSYFSEGVDNIPFERIFNALDSYDKDGQILCGLINFLNGITFYDCDNSDWRLRQDIDTYRWLNFGNMKYFQNLFSSIDKDSLTLEEILRLYSLYLFYRIYGNDISSAVMKEWLRFSANVIDASNLNTKEIVYSISSLELLCRQFPEIDIDLVKKSSYRGLDSPQIEEEVVKKTLTCEKRDFAGDVIEWEEKLFDYFHGQMRYPLTFSGFLGKQQTSENPDRFNDACRVLNSLFIEQPANREYRVYNLLTRAMLTKGEYMPPAGKNNGVRSFLVLFERDYSWKRFLKDGKKNGLFTNVVEDILKEEKTGKMDISIALDDIINKADLSAYPSWKKILISNPKIWGKVRYLGYDSMSDIWEVADNTTRNVWINAVDKIDAWVRPIRRKTLSGMQSELFSLDFYTRFGEKIDDVLPFTELVYYRGVINQEPSCAVLNDWRIGDSNFAIDIFRKGDCPEAIFVVRFFERNKKQIPKEICDILSEFSMTLSDSGDYRVEWKWAEDECFIRVRDLLSYLKTVSVKA